MTHSTPGFHVKIRPRGLLGAKTNETCHLQLFLLLPYQRRPLIPYRAYVKKLTLTFWPSLFLESIYIWTGWQKLCEGTKGLFQKIWTQTKINFRLGIRSACLRARKSHFHCFSSLQKRHFRCLKRKSETCSEIRSVTW